MQKSRKPRNPNARPCTWAVSYTHLDVYKRQQGRHGGIDIAVLDERAHIAEEEGQQQGADTVSYTHLDVYKRQPAA